ncbi:hypothetical protein NMG60_11021323 [Bertholletia excelsa]
MEKKPELLTRVTIDDEEDGVGDEEFYEKIEAPKFIDLTKPDQYRPDDRYWFCLRVGCDQKHEEELDHEAISKDFVLRVMAARSPNIRLRKVLNRKASSEQAKCPLSAPPKPRISRLALISSVSQNMVQAKGKVKPTSKLTLTPKAKGKQVAAKYLTTPTNKNCIQNSNSFRSVQYQKATNLLVPKNKTVAKALVFHSPKKGINVKTSSELKTPLTKICEGIRKLEITGQRKRVLGSSNKSSKEIKRDPHSLLPMDSPRKPSSALKDRSKAKGKIRPPNKDREMKSVRQIKRKSRKNSKKPGDFVSNEAVENNSSDMEIDMKSRDGSVSGNSRITEDNMCGKQLATGKNVESSGSSDSDKENPILDVVPAMKILDRKMEENDFSGNDQEEERRKSSEKIEEHEDHKNETKGDSGRVGLEGGAMMDSDDKENALASNVRRDFNYDYNHSSRKILGKQETSKITKKDRNLKEELNSAQVVKYKKPKPTNPKPFRLRTDERGILKEANLERRMQSSQKNDNCLEQNKHNQADEPKQIKTPNARTSEGRVRPKVAVLTPQRCSSSTPQRQKSIITRLERGRTNSPKLIASPRKAMASYLKNGKKLGVIKEETASTALKPNEAGEQARHGDSSPAHKASNSSASRRLQRGKRPSLTIPKEPKFHNIHVPKSCTRKVARV